MKAAILEAKLLYGLALSVEDCVLARDLIREDGLHALHLGIGKRRDLRVAVRIRGRWIAFLARVDGDIISAIPETYLAPHWRELHSRTKQLRALGLETPKVGPSKSTKRRRNLRLRAACTATVSPNAREVQ